MVVAVRCHDFHLSGYDVRQFGAEIRAASRLRVSVIAAHLRAGQFYPSIGLAITRIAFVYLRVTDIVRARDFYERLLEMKVALECEGEPPSDSTIVGRPYDSGGFNPECSSFVPSEKLPSNAPIMCRTQPNNNAIRLGRSRWKCDCGDSATSASPYIGIFDAN